MFVFDRNCGCLDKVVSDRSAMSHGCRSESGKRWCFVSAERRITCQNHVTMIRVTFR